MVIGGDEERRLNSIESCGVGGSMGSRCEGEGEEGKSGRRATAWQGGLVTRRR